MIQLMLIIKKLFVLFCLTEILQSTWRVWKCTLSFMLNTYFLNNYTELLDWNRFNPCKLGFYFCQLFNFLDECFLVDKESLTLIDENYEITSCDIYTGQKASVSLRDYTKWTTDIKKRISKEKYFDFFYCFIFSL